MTRKDLAWMKVAISLTAQSKYAALQEYDLCDDNDHKYDMTENGRGP